MNPVRHFEYHFQCLSKAFGDKVVIKDARLKVSNAQCTVLVGKNGAGKTTLLKLLSGLSKADFGCVRIDTSSKKIARCKHILLKHFMYLHQHPYMLDGTVEKNLRFSKKKVKNIGEAIEWARLQDLVKKDAKQLSGGEKQRVALARAYLRNPQVMLLDEPTANLDQFSKLRTMQLLEHFKNQGTAMVIATHDPGFFSPIQDEQLELKDGRLSHLNPKTKTSLPHKVSLK
jgi:tungstate transport system ATP-binding protein